MDVRLPRTGGTILLIGYGNTLRSDDGVGPRLALEVASKRLPGLIAIGVQQLTPELAEPLAAADLAIFVDARLAEHGDTVEVHPLKPESMRHGLAHTSNPRTLLTLACEVYGRAARSWLVTVPAVEFSPGEQLSVTARCAIADAIERITAFIECRRWDLR
jgi:hydrogenase maturation protease